MRRRRRGGGSTFTRANPTSHGLHLLAQVDSLESRTRESRRTFPDVNPKLIFRLVIHPDASITEEQVIGLGLQLLAIDAQGAMVVFPNEGTLTRLREMLREHVGLGPAGFQYSYLTGIEAIVGLAPEDRIGPRLLNEPLAGDEIVPLDVELWHAGTWEECQQNIGLISDYLSDKQLRVTDQYIGTSLCMLRARLNAEALRELTSGGIFDFVKEIDRRPSPSFELGAVRRTTLDELDVQPLDVDDESFGILIVDSGVTQGHPLLGAALGDAQAFKGPTNSGDVAGPEDVDELSGGHGTAVGGIAIYGDINNCISEQLFKPAGTLFSARVTNKFNSYDEDILLEHQFAQAVDYFVENYPELRVVNVSIGSNISLAEGTKYQFRLAALIDDLAFRYRDREILFVVSTGNFEPEDLTTDEQVQLYPSYLLESEDARLIDPATSAIALSVGGITYGNADDLIWSADDRLQRSIANERFWPSPFTRVGWGIGGSIKPDLVDFAGDVRIDGGRIATHPTYAGIPTTAKNFGPPEGALFRTVSGTSFAAPKVANVALRIWNQYPGASSNLVRALLADSARIPLNKPNSFANLHDHDDDALRIYGYGQPDFHRACFSESRRSLLITDTLIEVDGFQIFELPSLPDNFLSAEGTGMISIALAFDPPTRPTRRDSYLGVTMAFDLFRNVAPEDLANSIRYWSADEREGIARSEIPNLKTLRESSAGPCRIDLRPSANRRNRGTLQRARAEIRGSKWSYDQGALLLAVTCSRKWAPPAITSQRFAVVVSIQHENEEVDLVSHLRNHVRLNEGVRIRLQA